MFPVRSACTRRKKKKKRGREKSGKLITLPSALAILRFPCSPKLASPALAPEDDDVTRGARFRPMISTETFSGDVLFHWPALCAVTVSGSLSAIVECARGGR